MGTSTGEITSTQLEVWKGIISKPFLNKKEVNLQKKKNTLAARDFAGTMMNRKVL